MTARLPGTPAMLLNHWMKAGLVLLYAILLAFVLSQCGRLGEPAPQAPKKAALLPGQTPAKEKGPASVWERAAEHDRESKAYARSKAKRRADHAKLEAHLAVGVQKLIFVPYRYEMEQIEIIAREIIPRLKNA